MAQKNGLNVGDKAPSFTGADTSGKAVGLAELLKNGPVVLYFYPKDDTPGCTREACDFRDIHAEILKVGAAVIGVSPDSVAKHNKFMEKYSLNFPLISDPSTDICKAFGVWVEKSMYGKKYMGVERSTFLIAKNGKIAAAWRKVKVDGHAEEVLAAVKKLHQ